MRKIQRERNFSNSLCIPATLAKCATAAATARCISGVSGGDGYSCLLPSVAKVTLAAVVPSALLLVLAVVLAVPTFASVAMATTAGVVASVAAAATVVVVLAGVLPAGLAPGALLGATVMAGAVGGGVAVRSLTSSLGEGDGRGEPCTSVECMSGVGRWVHDVRRRGLRQVVCPGVCAGVSLCTNLTGFRNTFDKTKKKGKKINSTWVANRMLRCICIIEHHKLTMPTCLADSIPLLPVLPSAAPWW